MKKLIVLISLLVMAVTAYSQQLRPGSVTITPKMGINGVICKSPWIKVDMVALFLPQDVAQL